MCSQVLGKNGWTLCLPHEKLTEEVGREGEERETIEAGDEADIMWWGKGKEKKEKRKVKEKKGD